MRPSAAGPAQYGTHGRGPPTRPLVRGRYPVGVKATRDLAEAPPGRVLHPNPPNNLNPHDRRTPASDRHSSLLRRTPALSKQTLELVDRDQARTPRHLERLHTRQNATDEGRAAHPERRRRLAAGVGESFHMACLAQDNAPRIRGYRRLARAGGLFRPLGQLGRPGRWDVAARSLGAPLLAATRHPYSVHESWDASAPWCICVSPAIGGELMYATGCRRACPAQISMPRWRLRSSSARVRSCWRGWRSSSRPRAALMRARSAIEATWGRRPLPIGSRLAWRRRSS